MRLCRTPLEFRFARFRPEPWTPADVHLVGKVLSLSLCVNWEAELARMRMAQRVGEERTRLLDPSFTDHPPEILSGALAVEAVRQRGALRGTLGHGASNAWVVAGRLTASASRFSPTTRISILACRSSGTCSTWPGTEARSPASRSPAHRSSSSGGTSTSPGAPLAAFVDTQDLFVERFHADG